MLGRLDQGVGEYEGVKYQVTRRRGGGKKLNRDKIAEIIGEERMAEVEEPYRFEYPIVKVLET
jgi:hypothetical protein